MRFDAGSIDIPAAGTRVRWSTDGGLNALDRFLWAKFTPREGNTGEVYVGIADVSATHGVELDPSGSNLAKGEFVVEPGKFGGSIAVGDVYFDTDTNGNDIDWAVLLK